MEYSRSEMAARLEHLKPAIATKQFIEELTQIWFTGRACFAYNDKIAIEVPLKTELQGGLRGSIMLGVFSNSRAKTITIKPVPKTANEMKLVAGRTRLTLSLLDLERKPWDGVEVRKETMCPITEDFLEGLSKVLLTVGESISDSNQLGVTLLLEGETLNMMSWNGVSVSWVKIPCPEGYEVDRVILPTEFCVQILKLCKKASHFTVLDDCAVAVTPNNIKIWSTLVEAFDQHDFMGTFSYEIPKNFKKACVPIPLDKLPAALERCGLILDGQSNARLELEIQDGIMYLRAEANHGKILEKITLEKPHRDVVISLNPTPLKRILGAVESFMVTDRCIIMAGPGNFVNILQPYDNDESDQSEQPQEDNQGDEE